MPTPKGGKTWNAGTSKGWTDKRGYRWLYVEKNGKRVARREHRVIVERDIGRELEPWEVVHHIDENPGNNDLSNLMVVEFGAHTGTHSLGRRKDADARRSMEAFALMREELKRERALKSDLLEALDWIAQMATVRAADDKQVFTRVNRGALRNIAARAMAAIAKAEGRS